MLACRSLALVLCLLVATAVLPASAASASAPVERARTKYCGQTANNGANAFTDARGIGCERAIKIADKASDRVYSAPSGRVRVGGFICVERTYEREEDEPGFDCRGVKPHQNRQIHRTEL